ncbi:hypothetical protein AAF712_013641 [Marasmius tenuissimus]|uniref:Enoyl reductase (ER) domain-containing protein n=1 Tax=Marasmius tenuissimus TaxID=585030 RepID=A0ABR2ZE20_9AGAR
MSSQKALFLKEKQGPFSIDTRNIPSPADGEILIEIKAVALNPLDWKIQETGAYVQSYPAILGTSIAGNVVQLGEGAEGFSVGDRVLFQGSLENDLAGFQQFTKVSVEIAAKIPENLSYSQAASIPSGLATAAVGLFWTNNGAGLNPNFDKNVQYPDQAAVVIGGASSVGQYALQLLKFGGFSPIIAYASGHHTNFLKRLGATHIIDRKSAAIQDLPTEVKKITDSPVKVVYDAVSQADTQEAGYNTLAEGGDLVILLATQVKNVVESKRVRHIFGSVQPAPNRPFGRALFKNLTQFLEDGTIMPNAVEEILDGLAGIPAGLERLKKGQVSATKLIALPHETK